MLCTAEGYPGGSFGWRLKVLLQSLQFFRRGLELTLQDGKALLVNPLLAKGLSCQVAYGRQEQHTGQCGPFKSVHRLNFARVVGLGRGVGCWLREATDNQQPTTADRLRPHFGSKPLNVMKKDYGRMKQTESRSLLDFMHKISARKCHFLVNPANLVYPVY